ncbi:MULTISPECIES: hypothetical protein [Pasteurellaceae]|uniref:DUF1871 family protein n=1 Tax=Pasteurella atlantica TaxID=2827233 RepID=A0AAW8CJQ2_9PAST|nr:hypothetical protein [Pasteurella atlantica]MBR0573016.1 hypothetical protein [Pasteurella atlantica]MDP8038857.1 hypothetical protein [Pasteurella atlantica]MDP8041034.1 hypothetical protein [Pasteurella atlantica]MDP8043170.1 hypothetical protein [Pasteurella atlantica]MDP8045256.1 hypothetical protein [Pasteurella atlantica]
MINLKDLKKILFEEWDPIGINSNNLLFDEYDEYAKSLYKVLAKNDISSHQIIALLNHFESNIGTSSTLIQKKQTADKILACNRKS